MGTVQDFLEAASSQIGKPYVWGADSPQTGFDCSGLVVWAATQAGIPLGVRTTYQMAQAFPVTHAPVAGDLVLLDDNAHVGICLNDGCTQMLDAPETGANVRVDNVWNDVSSYRKIPGMSASSATDVSSVTNPLLSQTGDGQGSDIENLLLGGAAGLLGGSPSDALGAMLPGIKDIVTDVMTDFPRALIEAFFGVDVTAGELFIRGIEILSGMLVLSGGATLLLVTLVRNSGGSSDSGSDMYETVARQVRAVQRAEARRQQSQRGVERRATTRLNAQKLEAQHERGKERRTNAEINRLSKNQAKAKRENAKAERDAMPEIEP